MSRLGVCIVGAGGAVASTVIAGVALMKRGLAPRVGMVSETEVGKRLSCAPLESLVFARWPILWQRWVAAWAHEQHGTMTPLLPEAMGLIPPLTA